MSPHRASSADQMVAALIASPLRVLSRSRWKVGLAVAYHAVEPDHHTGRSPFIGSTSPELFRRHLRLLGSLFELVSAANLPAAAANRSPGERLPLAITLDDDLPQHALHALPALEAEGALATFFLCGRSLDRPRSFWWERLQRTVARHGAIPQSVFDKEPVPAGGLRETARAIVQMDPVDRAGVAERLMITAGKDPPDAGLRAADVRRLRASGHWIGFHTRDHEPLATLEDQALEDAMMIGRAELAAASGMPLDTLAYPHGEANHRVADAARRAGYRVAFTLGPGPIKDGNDPLLCGRILADGLSTRGLAARCLASLLRPADGDQPSHVAVS